MKTLLPYHREAGIAYAEKWALKRNPKYYDFAKIGGDCTNFVSQCLFEAAKRMNYTPTFGWYYKSLSNRSPSWSGATFLNRFLKSNHESGPQAILTGRDGIIAGDIIQLQNEDGTIYHTLYVLQTEDDILVAAHNLDSIYRPLETYTYANAIFFHILGVG